jgi:hypothetical protein
MTDSIAHPDGHEELNRRRNALDAARRELRRAAIALREAQASLAKAQRSTGRGNDKEVTAAQRRVAETTQARAAAAMQWRAAASELADLLGTTLPPTPEAEVARLDADRPIALLPVRLETRFSGNELLLRVYPDDVFADSHEPELTNAELDDGKQFWQSGWPDEAAERLAWSVLVDAVGAPRAAWVAGQTQPLNLDQRPGTAPVFSATAGRESAWTRAAEARLLPDRWIVALYRGGVARIETIGPVREPLALTLSPDPEDPSSELSSDGLKVDDASRWTLDFAAAEKAGMGKRIRLADEERSGFERVIVLGVKSSLSPELAAEALKQLLDNHRYSRGVALLPQGTPTNNTSAAPAPFPPADPLGSASFAVERRAVTPVAGRDGGRLMGALGLPAEAAEHWAGADGRSDDAAGAMARALWPATLRYFLEQMMDPVFGAEAIALAQNFFVNHIRGRGPFAAFRIGNTPYGVLPASSLRLWQPEKSGDALDRDLPGALLSLLPLWSAQVRNVPRVGRSADPDADLLAILGMEASTREARVRPVLGQDVQWNTFGLFGWEGPWQDWWDAGQALAAAVFERLGHPDWHPRIGLVNFADNAKPFKYELVSEEPVANGDTLSPNYVDWIRTAGVPDLMAERFPPAWAKRPSSLMYRLLRHAALLEYHDASFALLVRFGLATELQRREHELIGLPQQSDAPTRVERLAQVIPRLTGRQPLHLFLSNPANAAAVRAVLPQEYVVGFRDALTVLGPLPTAELERLFTETLDVVSHRIDAWITGLATKRLDRMRSIQPRGIHLGAYGWIEDLAPRPPSDVVALSGGSLAERQSNNGGFVQAPSLTHAAAAAVLRNAYLSRSGEGQEQFAVDLSSARVRVARFVLDAVREGQPLGAVLGYQMERGLHDRRQDVAIDVLRRSFPLVAGKSGDATDVTEPQEQIAARNVVDGLALRTAYREGRLSPELLSLPAGGPAWTAVAAEAAALDATVDAVSDLLLAESVYQIVKGSPGVAAATLDSMAEGKIRPPDPEIATVPRRGTPLTHRIAIVLGEGPSALPPGWPAAATPRAELEPWVDAWLGALFGDPRGFTCRVEFGPKEASTGYTTVSLDSLGLRPIDLLALARALGQEEQGAANAGASELDRRVRDAAYTKENLTEEETARISYGRPARDFDPVKDRSFADLFEIARAVEQVLRLSRPLTPPDLMAEDLDQEADTADLLPREAIDRANRACTRLNQALETLDRPLTAAVAALADAPFDLTALRNAMRDLALAGAPSAYPVSSLGDSASLRPPLLAQAQSVMKDGRDRLARALALLADAADASHAEDTAYQLKAAVDAAALSLGAATPFLPRFRMRPASAVDPSGAEKELSNALSYWTDPAFVAADGASRDREVARFEIVASRVRPCLDAWRRLELILGLLQEKRVPRTVAQLPYEVGARWAALPFADEQHRPRPGRVSLLMYRVAEPAASASWAGFLLDQWVEQIPRPTEQTGVTFHYEDPGAEAPQTILLAVPPIVAEHWDLASLLAVLNETLDLAKVRAVDGELLGQLGQVLPAIYLSDSTENVTVRTDFRGALQDERRITAALEG